MKSYASVERVEGKYLVCEVELLAVEESKPENYTTKYYEMMDIPLKSIPFYIGKIKEGDILVVEHDCLKVISVYRKDKEEKARRLEFFKRIFGDD